MAKKNIRMQNALQHVVKQKQDVDTTIKKSIIIKDELKDYIPPLSAEEFAKLEDNILLEGCRDALILWKDNQDYVLVDGHNRYKICSHHKIDFNFVLADFKNIDEVKDWMINNQLGKRNLTEEAKSYLRGQQYSQEKKQGKRSDLTSGQNVQKSETREKLAQQHKVSAKTIQRDEKYAQAIDKLVQGDNSLRWSILNRELDLPKRVAVELLEKTAEDVKAFKELFVTKKDAQLALSSIKNVKTAPVPPPAQKKNKDEQLLETYKSAILKAFKKLSQQPDKNTFAEFKTLVERLETELFGK